MVPLILGNPHIVPSGTLLKLSLAHSYAETAAGPERHVGSAQKHLGCGCHGYSAVFAGLWGVFATSAPSAGATRAGAVQQEHTKCVFVVDVPHFVGARSFSSTLGVGVTGPMTAIYSAFVRTTCC